MWLFVLLICFGERLLCNAQHDIDPNTQTATQDQRNQGLNRGDVKPPITLSIRDGRPESAYKPQDEVPGHDHPLFYSNQWQPFIMPIEFNQFGDRNRHETESGFPEDSRTLLTFLQRPGFESNSSATTERDAFTSTQMSFPSVVLYPNPFNLYPNANSEGNAIEILQNFSTPSPQIPPLSESIASNTKVNSNEILQSQHSANIPEGFYPLDFYRQLPEFTSPRSRLYIPPYSLLPIARDDSLETIVAPDFDRKPGLESNNENISPAAGASGVERPIASEAIPEGTIPNEASPIAPPPLPVPFPFGAYPFGIVPPPPVVPSLIPNTLSSEEQPFRPSDPVNIEQPFLSSALPRSLPFNPIPFVRIRNVRTENQAGDPIVPPPPVLPSIIANPPLEPTDVLPQLDTLDPALGENAFENGSPSVPYEFGFDMNDGLGTDQHRKEVSDGFGVVTGSYGYRDLFGVYRLVNYIADKGGFRAIIKSNEPGVATSRSADAVVMAEPPPPHAVAEGITIAEPEVVIASADGPPDLVAAASETESK